MQPNENGQIYFFIAQCKKWYNDDINPKSHLDEPQKAEIVDTSKLVPSVIIETHYWINHR